MKQLRSSSLFWAEEGFSTVGMVLALLISISLIFTAACVYEINSSSSRVQEVADAAALAAENTVGEFISLLVFAMPCSCRYPSPLRVVSV